MQSHSLRYTYAEIGFQKHQKHIKYGTFLPCMAPAQPAKLSYQSGVIKQSYQTVNTVNILVSNK